jgi:hypothetical protein
MTASNMSIHQVRSMTLKTKTNRNLHIEDWLHDYADRLVDPSDQEKFHLIADAFTVLRRAQEQSSSVGNGGGWGGAD